MAQILKLLVHEVTSQLLKNTPPSQPPTLKPGLRRFRRFRRSTFFIVGHAQSPSLAFLRCNVWHALRFSLFLIFISTPVSQLGARASALVHYRSLPPESAAATTHIRTLLTFVKKKPGPLLKPWVAAYLCAEIGAVPRGSPSIISSPLFHKFML